MTRYKIINMVKHDVEERIEKILYVLLHSNTLEKKTVLDSSIFTETKSKMDFPEIPLKKSLIEELKNARF